MERVLEAKVLAPVLPRVLVERPRVERVLAEALTRRLTTIVAPAGFGKSTLLAAWADQHRCAWYTITEDDTELDTLFRGVVAALRLRVTGIGEAIRDVESHGRERGPDAAEEDTARATAHAAYLSLQLQERLSSDLVLVLDDLHELEPGSAPARFVEALCRQAPRGLHLVVLSRRELPFPVARLRSRGLAAEISGALLAFDLAETTALAAQVGAPDASEAARQVQATTLGWPAAVRLGAEALRERAQLPAHAQRGDLSPEGIIDLLAGEVFANTEPTLTELVRRTCPLDGFTVGVCTALGVANPETAIGTLERRGLLRAHSALTAGWYSLHPLVRTWAERQWSDPAEAEQVREVAAGWMLEHGLLREALHLLAVADRRDALVEALLQHGSDVLAEGGAEDLLRHLRKVAGPQTGPGLALLQLEGEARHTVGDWDGALACFERLDVDELLPAGAAWRSGFIHHQRGDLSAALAAYERCAPAEERTTDHAMVDALCAGVHWLRGDLTRCRELAERAYDVARALEDDRSLAAAHTALAMLAALAGDRRTNDAHYLRALTHAERAGDTLQLIRIHSNRGSRYLEEGDYDDALAELDTAVGLADLAGFAMLR
ncbi:AAA family ATPase, partial [Nocardioides sp.]|uniref:AAA family ATPase n=1 Tax=Nocardioides sp. TaxID=35761 RepID=UPI002732E66F